MPTVPRRAVAAVVVALGFVSGVPGASYGDPTSVPAARRDLIALNRAVDVAVEDLAQTRIALQAARRRAASAQARVARAEAELSAARGGLDGLVAAVYVSGGTSFAASLLTTSSPTDFLDRASMIDAIARTRTRQLREVSSTRRRLRGESERAGEAVQVAAALARRAADAQARIESQVARQQALLDRLESAEARRARLAREARAARWARERLQRASREREVTPAYSGAASGRATIAVRAAYAQLGKPYRWGAAGPDRFDCSGLTMYVWAKAGVSLPHSSRAQRQVGRSVSRAELRPGDLIFRGRPTIHHVGIYIGDGRMISAPQTGDVVKISNAFAGEYAGAVRV